MAIEKGFTNVVFSRLRNFVPPDSDFKLPDTLDEISYVANATNFRRFILNNFGKDDLDVDYLIAVDEDTRLTYQGYRRFLMSDLRHIFTLGDDRTGKAYKRETKYLAKQMLARGYVSEQSMKNLEKWITNDIIATGFRRSNQAQLSASFAALYSSVHRRAQSLDELAKHKNRVHNALALQCCSDGRWRMGQRSDGRFQKKSQDEDR